MSLHTPHTLFCSDLDKGKDHHTLGTIAYNSVVGTYASGRAATL